MKSYGLCFLVSFVVSVLSLPILINLSSRWGAVSEVGGRNVGTHPVGRLGGIGICLGFLSSVLLIVVLDSSVGLLVRSHGSQIIGILGGALLISSVGLWDDIRRIPALRKLLVQILGSCIAYFQGLRLEGVDLPFLEPLFFGWLSLPITVLWIVGVVNAINLIDGLDGLAGGIVFFACATNFLTAVVVDGVISALLMACTGGAVLGFILYNWHPAKIYMGDCGSYFLGFVLATSSLLTPIQKASTGISILIPVLAMGIPIFDTLFAMFRRALSGRGVFSPDRGHIHHLLLDSGITHRRVVLGLYGLSLLLAGIALSIALRRNPSIGYIIIGSSTIGLVIWGISIGRVLRAQFQRDLSERLSQEQQLKNK